MMKKIIKQKIPLPAISSGLTRKYKGKKIWVIGASRGMGLALARILSLAGAEVITSSRTEPFDISFPHKFIPLDVADLKKLKSVCQKMKNLDGVVYMSGLHKQNLIADMNDDDLLSIVRVNMEAPTIVAKYMAGKLEKKRGFLAICGSQTSFIGAPLGQPYSASKAYLLSLAETLCLEHPKLHIHLLAPGFVKTDLVKQITMPMPFSMTAEAAAEIFAKRIMGVRMVIAFPLAIKVFPPLWRYTPLWVKKILWQNIKSKAV